MLQADNSDTTNQLLAFSVSTQLRTARTIISDTLNNTLASLADAASTSFSPSTATRWINILFFLSLVFSLAAALFSILAKQWIREYIKRNSPLALPRENVLFRRVRIEAWEDWHVPMILSFILILLELGMILFLAGVIIPLRLWTLDDVVAKVVTVSISIFLGAFTAFTALPIFKRCPYRSPTVWACLMLLKFISLVLVSWGIRLRIYQLYDGARTPDRDRQATSADPDPLLVARSWRKLDPVHPHYRSSHWGIMDWPNYRLDEAARLELSREMADFKESGELDGASTPDCSTRRIHDQP